MSTEQLTISQERCSGSESLIIRGARQHNLKNIDLVLPRNRLIVITGLSGSGKSSLAFDTIYAEGQRRYVESLSAYARQFLELMEKPEVEQIDGLSPAIAIQQRTPAHNPRSTVGTVTEIYDYLRLLFARIGNPHCPKCGRDIRPQSAQQIIEELLSLPTGNRIEIFASLVRDRIGSYQELFSRLKRGGYLRVRVDGKIYRLDENIKLARYRKHRIDLAIDRLVAGETNRERLADSVETALREGRGVIQVSIEDKKNREERMFSEHYACIHCGINLPEIEPRMFSFNSPYGACPQCDGLGTKIEIDPELVIPDSNLSIGEGVLHPWTDPITTRTHRWKYSWSGYYTELLDGIARRQHIPLDRPFSTLTTQQQRIILYGEPDGEFEGVITNLERRYRETESDYVKEEIFRRYMSRHLCPLCQGTRLKKEVLAVTIAGKSIAELTSLSVGELAQFFQNLKLSVRGKTIAHQILKEIQGRLSFLASVGLDYITLNRESASLAGGEAQRIHLATQIGSGLVGVLYVLDEPTVGLHPRDTQRLLASLLSLRDRGNTLLVVEHDEETIRAADWIVDLGPGAGRKGGEVVVSGPISEVLKRKTSLTGAYLRRELQIPLPEKRRKPGSKSLQVKGAAQFNLKDIDVDFPLGLFIGVTGVSGSGKSTLVEEILYKYLVRHLSGGKETPGRCREVRGIEYIDKVIVVDQSPIGRTPRSNPATYTGAFTPIRQLFAQIPEARRRGYSPGRFSFNIKGGRCENCQGDGTLKIEMQFLPDVYVRCEICQGKRFNAETLQIRYKGKNIAEVLEMSITDAREFFQAIPLLNRLLGTLEDVGLGYLQLGQSAPTLSGGEAQRVKLATELGRVATGETLYILDEPTTGLHFADVEKLLQVLHRLVDRGNTVIVIEHNLEVVKTADWIIDLGPEGGKNGGYLVASGSPEAVARNPRSYTGKYLQKIFR